MELRETQHLSAVLRDESDRETVMLSAAYGDNIFTTHVEIIDSPFVSEHREAVCEDVTRFIMEALRRSGYASGGES